jgi:hypothetical protein
MTRWLLLFLGVVLSACGGGGDAVVAVTAPAAITLSGTAATGAAIAGRIYLKDAAGHEQFVDTTDGRFSFTVTGLSPPFMLKAQWSVNGTTQTLYSLAATAAAGTVNITPLTHLALVSAAGAIALDAAYAAGSASTFATIAAALPAALAQVQQSFAPLFAAQGVAHANPFGDVFAADHGGMDAVLDGVSVSYLAGTVTVADKASGAVVLEAPSADLSHAMTMPEWGAQNAALAADLNVAVAAGGDGLAVWSEPIAGRLVIRARFLLGHVGSAVTLSNSGDAGLPKPAFDAAGNAVVAWTQFENNRNDIWAARYTAASGTWGVPLRLSAATAVADANVPDVAVDGAGNAIVVWHQGDGRVNHFDVWSAVYSAAGDAWTAPVMQNDVSFSAANPHVALNGAGQGIVAWEQGQTDGTAVSNGPQDIWGRSATSAGVLGTSRRLNAVAGNVDGVYGQVAVAMDPQGNGFALWVQGSGTLPFVIHAARFASTNGWQASTVITSNALDNCYGPHLAFDATGNAVAVWQQQTGVGAFGGVTRYDAVSGWAASGAIGNDVPGDVYDPRIAVDGAGNATVVWYQWDTSSGALTVMFDRQLAGGSWGASRLLSPTTTTGFLFPVPRVASNAAGQTLAVWGINSN